MTALSVRRLDGEIIPPSARVSVIGTLHPLNAASGARIRCEVAAGSSIDELLDVALASRPGWRARYRLVVCIAGHEIEQAYWTRVRVKPGVIVTFRPRLQGSDTIWRSVLTVVVAIAAFALAAPTGGASLVAAAGFEAGTTAAAIASAVVAATVIAAGTLAINALFPIRPPASSSGSVNSAALNSIQGAQNVADPFGPIPVVLGRHRQSPRMAAKPYTEINGRDQWLQLLLVAGYGPLLMEDFKVGETPLSSYTDYEIDILQGYESDPPTYLYRGNVDEVPLSIQMDNTVDAPGVVGTGGDWQTQISSPDSDVVSVDFAASEGCFAVNDKGAPDDWRVPINVRYRPVAGGAYTTVTRATEFQRYTAPDRRGYAIQLPARGQYEIGVQKGTGNGNSDKIKDTIVWTAIRSQKASATITFPKPLAKIALRIKATDQLSGVINTLNCVCTSLVTAFNGTSWVPNTASRNPADLFRYVLQGPANARPVADAAIDIDNLEAFWADCVANGWVFDQVVTAAGNVNDKLWDICAAAFAAPIWINGRWGVVWDRPEDDIVDHFTPRNSWDFQGQKPYPQQPHGWRVSFINRDNGFTQDERIVYDDGYDETNATLFEAIEFPGVTDPDLIWKLGRRHIAQSRLRPEKITLKVGWEQLVCTKGDRVRVTHDVMLIGLASGRVKAVAGQVVTFDEQVTIEGGKAYSMQFRVPDDIRVVDRSVHAAVVAGDYRSLTLVGDLSLVAAALDAGSAPLFGFGEAERESAVYRVQEIVPDSDLAATLVLVDDAPDISTADTGEIPAYNPNVTVPPDPFSLPPRDLQYFEAIDGFGTAARAIVRLSWQVPRFGRITAFEVQQRDDDVGGPWVTVDSVPPPRTSTDVPLINAGVWSFRVRCVFSDGTVSAWVSLIGLNLAGLTFPPDDITNLHLKAVDGQTVLDWNIVADQRLIDYEIRKGTSWDTGLVVGDVVSQPPWATTGDGTYHVRAYVLSPFGIRIYSVVTSRSMSPGPSSTSAVLLSAASGPSTRRPAFCRAKTGSLRPTCLDRMMSLAWRPPGSFAPSRFGGSRPKAITTCSDRRTYSTRQTCSAAM
jgi:hypothetical protein